MATPTTSDAPSAPPQAATFTEAWLPGPDGTQFYTRTYPSVTSPPRAVLLFVHGFAEHCARYEWAHGLYAAQGITVFTYDQRGFGRTALDKAKKSKGSSYGKTSAVQQLGDIEWWLKHVRREHPAEVPVFLMGHSMGGGLALAFGTRTSGPPAKETVSTVSGVIASSPLVLLTFPPSKILRYIGGKASAFLPNLPIDAPIAVEDLSHDPVANQANVDDKLIIQKGTLKGVDDMMSGGEHLLANDHKHWPHKLPLLVVHGDADRVTSFKASQELFDKLDAEDKTFSPYKGGYHELVHEPEGVKEAFVEECVSWVLKHVDGEGGAGRAKL